MIERDKITQDIGHLCVWMTAKLLKRERSWPRYNEKVKPLIAKLIQ
jgi:hypothetical protein